MKVGYEGYTDFNQQYGHIFYNKPFSYYLLKVQYRFVGEQVKGGEGWAYRNSGAMLHCQDPKTMLKDQDFPISIEGQILGGDGVNERHTSNVCTPGTTVYLNDKLNKIHCIESMQIPEFFSRKETLLIIADHIVQIATGYFHKFIKFIS